MKHAKRPLLIVAILLAALAVACGGGGGGGDDPKGTVEALFNAFNDKNADNLYDLMSKDCQGQTTKEEFKTGMTFAFTLLGDGKFKIESIDVKESGDSATASVKGKLEGGPFSDLDTGGEPEEVKLKKEDGKWKISSCDTVGGFGGGFSPTATQEGTETPESTGTGEVTETPESTETGEATETPESTETGEATETPEATGTVPSEGKELPKGYPEDLAPVMEGGVITDAAKFSSGGTETFTVTYVLEGSEIGEAVDFYKDRFKSSGFEVFDFSSEDSGFVTGSISGDTTKSLSMTVSPSTEVSGAIEVVLLVVLPEGGVDATAEPTESGTPESTDTAEPEATGTLPEGGDLPDGYPEDLAPIMEGGAITDAGAFSSGDQETFTVVYVIEGEDAEAVVDFYDQAFKAAGWETFSGTTSDTDGSVIATNPEGESFSGIVSVTSSTDVEGALEVTIVVTVQAS